MGKEKKVIKMYYRADQEHLLGPSSQSIWGSVFSKVQKAPDPNWRRRQSSSEDATLTSLTGSSSNSSLCQERTGHNVWRERARGLDNQKSKWARSFATARKHVSCGTWIVPSRGCGPCLNLNYALIVVLPQCLTCLCTIWIAREPSRMSFCTS
ncbi:hypothetical protein JRQ81_006787 [Phrynocephalus forsythii]|uniref:Uncharacterized protein n=1 Tax=Phrynocephalus forsythii TaxID=171643 RepID=A0A9Q1AUB0_9SAUR|nr:hypothetical protein JRQ81_006787 [Phrynocephalus forsythii]